VGTQIALAAWSVVLGFLAMALVFRTTDWRDLIRQAEEDESRERGEGGSEGQSAVSPGKA
jgi:hypothetical protein